ncbi:hypothetical protein VCB98_05165 [Gammaproteobacteria bacterium AB-CW1]|uniref:SPOR domain-containing protein n=1 Tax=Natronospira elongata TaxID=3110268 RepID=A0AAP6JEV5_9GAMM|nr:hypothetical protein [Gammaproteobacteria bacterium AB-CW1]
MLRLIFLLLLALNLVVLAWQAWHAPDPAEELVRIEPNERYQLAVAEPDLPESDLQPREPAEPQWRPGGCVQLGGVDGEEALRAFKRLRPELSAHLLEIPESVVFAWWVIIPPDGITDADETLAALEAAGAGDYFLIRSGEGEGGISLGLFSTPERAELRRDRLQERGFSPDIRERERQEPRYWLLMPEGRLAPEVWQADHPEWRLRPALCPGAEGELVDIRRNPLE